MKVKPFARQGHYVVFDTALLDYVMPGISHTAWKILCYIIRRTRGWQKDHDKISYRQIKKGTGIKSDTTVSSGLKLLVSDKKIVLAQGSGDKWTAYTYGLNADFELEIPTPKNEVAVTPKNEVGPAPKNGDSNNNTSL